MPLDVKALLDPEVADAVALFPVSLGILSDELLPAIRGGMGVVPVELSDAVARRDVQVPSGDDPPVTIRIHTPKAAARGARPCVYWMHGGGYVLGTYEMDDARFDAWCQQFDCVGVAVEYRLAPETPYPGPLQDAYAGLAWVFANAAELGVDPNRIGIGGASAGAGLAAGLGLYARDQGHPLRFQLLIYPMLDDRFATTSSTWDDPIWPPSANTYGWKAYLGDLFGRDDVPIYAAAARATDLTGLPPTWIGVGSLDGFVDEDVDYAMRLNRSGVPTELHVYPGAPHGFDGIAAATRIARNARRDVDDWLARVL